MQTGIIIGRFQVPSLHIGHLWLISEAIRENDRIVILIGTQKKKDDKNPYDYITRKRMMQKYFPQAVYYPLADSETDEFWSAKINTYCTHYPQPTLYHSRDSFKDHYKGKYPLKEIPELEGYSGTKSRALIKY